MRTWQLIDEEKIDVMLKVPAMLNFMLQVYDPERCKHERLSAGCNERRGGAGAGQP